MTGEELNATRVGTKGFYGDRVFAIADAETGKIASAKNPSKWPTLFSFRAAFTEPLAGAALPSVRITLPDGGTVSTGDQDIAARLSSSLGKPVYFLKGAAASGTLEEYWPDIDGLARRDVVTDEGMPAETFFDLGMIHLLTTATLDSFRGCIRKAALKHAASAPIWSSKQRLILKAFPKMTGTKKLSPSAAK